MIDLPIVVVVFIVLSALFLFFIVCVFGAIIPIVRSMSVVVKHVSIISGTERVIEVLTELSREQIEISSFIANPWASGLWMRFNHHF